MEIITIDWETYYSKDYSLTKLTTEEYIRDSRFEAIMLGVRMPDGELRLIEGTYEEIQYKLGAIDWSQYAVLAHKTMFDGAILAWQFGIKPAVWLDTLSMARAMFGIKGNSLSALAQRYNLDEKGTYVVNMMGKRRADMSDAEFAQYAQYCLKDVELCHQLFTLMSEGWYDLESMDLRHPYPVRELELIDRLIRMYTEPSLMLNQDKLEAHLKGVVNRKEALLAACAVDKDILMSNPKFAELLSSLGVAPPMKISPATGKLTFAFAKTDPGMKDLLEHPDERVQVLVSARLGVKSTLEETRTTRFIDIAKRGGLFPIPLKYSAARTHRLGGMDKINLQNLPARGKDAKRLKKAIEPPKGWVIINSDSSNIEARMLAWLAEQEDLVSDFANKVDVYSKMASRIYNREVNRKRKVVVDGKEIYPDEAEGFVGKTVVLGCGYMTGAMKLQITLKAATPPMDMPLEECQRIITTYRSTYPKIPNLWKQADKALHAMHDDQGMWLGKEGVLWVEGKKGIKLPNGLYISYPSLHQYEGEMNGMLVKKWRYKDEKGLQDIYGGKLIENCLSGDSEVLTDSGWKRITAVSLDDRVWNGTGWVRHTGVVCNGVQQTINFGGVWMTPDHKVLVDNNWIESQHATYEKATSSYSRSYGVPTCGFNNTKLRRKQREEGTLTNPTRRNESVYDITNAGPNHRFTVRGKDGRPFLVHNCVQALARIIVMLQLLKIAKRYTVPLTVHDAVVVIAKEAEAQEALRYTEECMRWIPKWAHGCPINCEAFMGANYGEC